MPRKLRGSKLLRQYRQRSEQLRAVGIKVSGARRLRSGQKGEITKKWKAYRFYLVNAEKNRVEFVKADERERRLAEKFNGKATVTPTGFFFQRPKGVRKGKIKYKFFEDHMEIKGGKLMNDIVINLDVKKIVVDPLKEVKRVTKKYKRPREAKIMVNGFQGKNRRTLKGFFEYFNDELLPYLKAKDLNDEEIEEIFQLRLIY